MNVEVLEEISNDPSRLAKESKLILLDKDMRMFVRLALDQDITFGVTIDEDEAIAVPKDFQPEEVFVQEFHGFLEACSTRTLSGGAAQQEMARVIQMAPSALHAKWAARIINRNLRAGFDIKIFNAVFGDDKVKKFAVQLAESWEGQDLKGEWIFEPKLNGNRVVCVKGVPRSRGNRVYDAALPVIGELRALPGFLDAFVPDGEMMGNLGFDQSSGALRRQNSKNRAAVFDYWVFDLFGINEYGGHTATLRERKERLLLLFKEHRFEHIHMVPWQMVKDPTHADIDRITKKFIEAGFEGAMAKRLDAYAKFDRGPDLLKCKLFYEDEFRVVGFYEGRGRNKGSLGGFWVEGDITWGLYGHPQLPRHVRSKCGGGFSDALRAEIWRDQDGWLGAVVQVQFQEVTAKGSLQFPEFVTRRKDKEQDGPALRAAPVPAAKKRGRHAPAIAAMTPEETEAMIDELESWYRNTRQ